MLLFMRLTTCVRAGCMANTARDGRDGNPVTGGSCPKKKPGPIEGYSRVFRRDEQVVRVVMAIDHSVTAEVTPRLAWTACAVKRMLISLLVVILNGAKEANRWGTRRRYYLCSELLAADGNRRSGTGCG